MEIIPMLQKEMEQEAQTTRKMLALVPTDKFDWQPHPKSMSLKRLATHIAELPTWVTMVLNTSELDFEKTPYEPVPLKNTEELLEYFEKSLEDGKASLAKAKKEELTKDWTLRSGDQIYSTDSKAEVIRMTFSQIVHHRAQLGVNLRLLNIPIPGSYGPSADDVSF